MLVKLPHGFSIDPEIVKYVLVRVDRSQGQPGGAVIFSVVVKNDVDEHLQVLASFDNRAEAEELSAHCANLINKALGVEDEEEEEDDFDADNAFMDDDEE